MTRPGRAFVSGHPLPCTVCRTPFTPSAVTSARRITQTGLQCPRCRKVEKAQKAERKKNG